MLGLFLASSALAIAVGLLRILGCEAEEVHSPLGRLEAWVAFLLGFGLAGAPLAAAGATALGTVATALLVGLALGAGAHPLLAEAPPPPSLEDASGREARVLVPVCARRGRVVVESLAGRLELPARSLDGRRIGAGSTVWVATVERGVAQVTHL